MIDDPWKLWHLKYKYILGSFNSKKARNDVDSRDSLGSFNSFQTFLYHLVSGIEL